jgi:hypothetical protein
MTYPQQPGGWSDPAWSRPQPEGESSPPAGSPAPGYPDPSSPYPPYADPANGGYPGTPAPPAGGYPGTPAPTTGGYPGTPAPTTGGYPGTPAPTTGGYPPGIPTAGGYQAGGYQAGGYPPAGYGTAPSYPQPYGYMAVPPRRPNNGLAIAALVVSCVGVLGLCAYGLGGWIGAIGAILGHVARRQIRERGDGGDGMALAGVIVGWVATGLFVLAAIGWGIGIWYAASHSNDTDSASTFIRLMVG